MIFEEVAKSLEHLGFVDVVLPSILVFALTFGILQRTKVVGNRTNVMAMISFVFAFLSVAATTVLNVVNMLAAYFVILLITGLLFAMLLGITGVTESHKSSMKILGGVLMALLAIGMFSILVAEEVIDAERFFNVLLLPLLVIAALIAAVIYVLRPEKKPKEPDTDKKPAAQKPEIDISGEDLEKKKKDGVLWKG